MVYPEYDWIPWKFKQVPRGFWADEKNHRKFFDWLAKELNMKTLQDWQSVPSSGIQSFRKPIADYIRR